MENTDAIAFFIAYILLCLFLIWQFFIVPIIKKFKSKNVWIYGNCNNRPARKHSINGNVQFVLWKAGEQGHKEDFWIDFDSSWWICFKKENHN